MSDQAPPTPSTPPPATKRSAASIGLAVLGFAATLGLGFFAGQWLRDRPFVQSIAERLGFAEPAKLSEGDRYKVELRGDEAQLGPDDALVTIIEFSDFQCPFCSRVIEPLKGAMDSYEGDVRLIFKHFPLGGHPQAGPAGQATWAAQQQGKFWEMHDLLFANQKALGDADLEKYATQLGLDVAKFNADRTSDAAKKAVEGDLRAGTKVGVSGTPSFMVNGHSYSGAMPAAQWRQIFEHERKAAQALVDAGTPRAQVYEALMKDAKTERARGSGKATRGPGEPDPDKTYKVPVAARPQHGPDDALVTLVVISDFQCPFCKRVNPTLDKIKETYAQDVRIVFLQHPIPSHEGARDGARASLAAFRQGKFWEMHDKLFSAPSKMDKATIMGYAQELGLDTATFELDMAAADLEQMIRDDEKLAVKLGARGTPAFFVNGRYLSGAMPFETFAALIDEEKAKAQKMVDAGTPRGEVYAKILASAAEKPGA
jgi:protein-disulfide isomerase